MCNFYVIHPKHAQETASTERGWNPVSLSIYYNSQIREQPSRLVSISAVMLLGG